MRRGSGAVLGRFQSVPFLPATSQAKARALVERLTEWQYESRLLQVPFGEIQREVVLTVPPPARVIVYRRLMVRIAEALPPEPAPPALPTGEGPRPGASRSVEHQSELQSQST